MAKSNDKTHQKQMDKNCHIPDLVQAFLTGATCIKCQFQNHIGHNKDPYILYRDTYIFNEMRVTC